MMLMDAPQMTLFEKKELKSLLHNSNSGAVISSCEKYRYKLWRIWDRSLPSVLFIMLNPSTADDVENDRTITRCINFAKSWGFGSLYVGNLFAFRSKKPKDLYTISDPIGPENLNHLSEMVKATDMIILAYGNGNVVKKLSSDKSMLHLLQLSFFNQEFWCIDKSKDNIPCHPLYLKKTLVPEKIIL